MSPSAVGNQFITVKTRKQNVNMHKVSRFGLCKSFTYLLTYEFVNKILNLDEVGFQRVAYCRTVWTLMMMADRAPILQAIVAVVVCGLMTVDDVTSLPLQPCSLVIDHVDSEIAAAQPVPASHIRLYLACLGVEHQRQQRQLSDDDDDAVRQLLALQPNAASADDDDHAAALDGRSKAESIPGVVCTTLECLGRRATLTFEPCSRLTQAQCSELVSVLEYIVSPDSDVDFRHFVAQYSRKRNQSRVTAGRTRKKRHVDATKEEAVDVGDRDTGNDKTEGITSSRVISGTGSQRMRRSTAPEGTVFRMQLTPETETLVADYKAWRAENGGYGRMNPRWG